MTELSCVIWDVDGTLVDSEDLIQRAMAMAYGGIELAVPERAAIRGMVGLSLDLIFPRLSPELGPVDHAALAQGYRNAYARIRAEQGSSLTSPFYPGMRAVLETLRRRDNTIMTVATGKSRRGLDKLIEGHGLDGWFASLHCADDHPSKPDPSMLRAVMRDTGVEADRCVMIGDTTYDMEMGHAAGMRTVGVAWGFHDPARLVADRIAPTPEALPALIEEVIG